MRFDSGEVTFYRKTNIAENGLMPQAAYDELEAACYAELTVGIARFSQAKQYDAQIDMLIRIPQTYNLRTKDAAVIAPYSHDAGDGLYKVYQIQQTEDEDGLPVTDVSFERYTGIDAGKTLEAIRGAGGSE